MEKEELITNEIEKAKTRREQTKELEKAYAKFIQTRSKSDYDDLMSKTNKYCASWVYRHTSGVLISFGLNAEDILQEGSMQVVRWLQQPHDYNENFHYAPWVMRVYQNKLTDLIRDAKPRTNMIDYRTISEDTLDDQATIQAKYEDDYWKNEKRIVSSIVIKMYCKATMELKENPEQLLALCYARIFPHMIGDIIDTKAVSPKYAIQKMGQKSIDSLSIESQNILIQNIDKTLHWSEYFRQKLDEPVEFTSEKKRLGDLIYTIVFTASNIQYWATQLHPKVGGAAARLIAQDRVLFQLISDHLDAPKARKLLNLDRKEEYDK